MTMIVSSIISLFIIIASNPVQVECPSFNPFNPLRIVRIIFPGNAPGLDNELQATYIPMEIGSQKVKKIFVPQKSWNLPNIDFMVNKWTDI